MRTVPCKLPAALIPVPCASTSSGPIIPHHSVGVMIPAWVWNTASRASAPTSVTSRSTGWCDYQVACERKRWFGVRGQVKPQDSFHTTTVLFKKTSLPRTQVTNYVRLHPHDRTITRPSFTKHQIISITSSSLHLTLQSCYNI